MSAALWTAQELVDITGGRLVGEAASPVCGFSIDSRTLQKGDAYVAIRGDIHDGHKFTASSLKAGAALAIVSKPDDDMRAAGPLLVVDEDPLDALEKIARAARSRFAGRVLAITGSVGKTGTKEMLRACLSKCGTVHASQKSYNNHWGVPLTLANLPSDADYGVFEVGMNHPGEILQLVDMIKPQIAIITNVEPVHLGQFNSVAEIADAKAEIFTGLEKGGMAILNSDNAYFDHLKAAAQKCGVSNFLTFGANKKADVQLTKAVLHGSCSCVQVDVAGTPITYKMGAPGEHLVKNSLAVLASVHLLGADLALAGIELGKVSAPPGRGQRTRLDVPTGGSFTLIDEAYNANPTSMRAALRVLQHSRPDESGRRLVVMGDMLELGDKADEMHRDLLQSVDEASIDGVYACGLMMKHLWDVLPAAQKAAYSKTSKDLLSPLLTEIRAGDVVMIKGSLGSNMLFLVDALKKQFSEHNKTED